VAAGGLFALVAFTVPSAASAGSAVGTLDQLKGAGGCLVDRSQDPRRCTPVRALRGPAPFLGSNAIAISPDGRNLYVASSRSNAIAVLIRNKRKGTLSQARGVGGCSAAGGAHGCASAVGLEGPSSVAVSPDGESVYATSVGSDSVTVFQRNTSTGALTQASDASGCVANSAISGCTVGRALDGADVIVVSPDGANVYVGAFFGNAIAVFNRDLTTGALTQPQDATGCIVNTATSGCTTGLALAAPEGMAISADGNNVYAATAVSNAVLNFVRDPSTGALSQANDGTGCIANSELAGCTVGIWVEGANAVAVSADDDNVYVTSLLSNSLTSFSRDATSGALTQLEGTEACVIYIFAVGCSLGRALSEPEGVTASPDGASVYTAAFDSNAVGSFNRDEAGGAVMQRKRLAGCVTSSDIPDCEDGRALREVSSLVVSPNGRQLYAAAFASDAVAVFKRVTVGG
jgi:DNA-binding beta-propeller fold protein YncE